MRSPRLLLALSVIGAAACGPTYVVQGPPRGPEPQQVEPPPPPPPPRVPPMEVSIVRTEEGRVLVQTSRQAYLAVFEIVPGRGVSLVYPEPVRPRNVQYTGLTWLNLSWTMRADYRFASSDTRYIYAVASDTPLRLDDDDYDSRHLQRALGSTYWSSNPNATVRAIAREFVRAQPDEWWGEDMTTMPLMSSRVTIAIRLARVYCPDGNVFEVREDMVERVWCPARRGGPRRGERPGAAPPDSVFGSNGRKVARRMDPTVRTPIFRVPAGNEVGQQQGHPVNQPHNPPPGYPRTQPQNPQTPAPTGNPQTPPQNQPPQNQPPQNQPPQNPPPQTQPPQNQPPQLPPAQDPNGGDRDHHDNGRRAHGDPQNADPRGNGNGYGNGGRNTPSTQPPSSGNPPVTTPPQSNPQQPTPPQQNPPQTPPNNGQGHGNDNAGNNGNHGNTGNTGNNGNDKGKGPNDAKPDHADAPKNSVTSILKNRGPQPKQDKKAPADSTTDKKKP
jgi:hypothetical protein